MSYKLCYVDNKFLWFSEIEPTEIWGDDWDDVPYEHNAGEPYSEYGPYKKIVYDGIDLYEPNANFSNSQYSVNAINQKFIPWLCTPPYKLEPNPIIIYAGCELGECIRMLKSKGATIYVEEKDELII